MSDITEYERRISAALARIGRGLDALRSASGSAPDAAVAPGDRTEGQDGAAAAEVTALQEALEAERSANAQLTERVRAIKDKQETTVASLEKKVARLTEQLDASGADLQRQRRLNSQLTEANAALRDAATQNLTEPHLINKSMLTELEALRAQRASERIEMEEILAELKPLIGEASHA